MRRVSLATAPTLIVAVAAFMFASVPLGAQQAHDHGADPSAPPGCACCGNSGSGAANHAAGGGCGSMAAMQHGAGGGCCGTMAGSSAAPATDQSTPPQSQPPSAAAFSMGGCSATTAANQAPDADHSAHGQPSAPAAAASPTPMKAGGCGAMAMGGDGSAPAMKGMGGMADPSMMADMQVFHFLLANRADIRRVVTELPNGIETETESDNPEVAAQIKVHVPAMYRRLTEARPIHQRDPLFAELFAHADQIVATITSTEKGVHVVETSTDPAVVELLHKHAATVDAFIRNGMPEMMKNHLE